MASSRRCALLYLLLWAAVASAALSGEGGVALARPAPPPNSHFGKYAEVLETLGVECKCCDGASSEGECRSAWTGTCAKMQCLPWKFH